ncbi:hypothetical protein [Alicyclobacillus pomorum]|uniref:hypothetical protein n=1 Tax=Alicyclobacillus pomorum TaxID=204470 RepID=UPI00041BEE21|nr:hypothetical protein [Alicyclobacillus pomorum]
METIHGRITRMFFGILIVMLSVNDTVLQVHVHHSDLLDLISCVFMLVIWLSETKLSSWKKSHTYCLVWLAVALVVAWSLIVFVHSPNHYDAVKDIFSISLVFLVSLEVIPSIFSFSSFVDFFNKVLLIIITLAVLFGQYNHRRFLGYENLGISVTRFSGLFYHPNLAGLYAAMLGISALLLFAQRHRLRIFVSLAISVCILYLTHDRTAQICFLFYAAGQFAWTVYCRIKSKVLRWTLSTEFIMALLILVLLAVDYLKTHTSFYELNYLLSGRLSIWNLVLSNMNDRLFGDGLFLPGQNQIFDMQTTGYGIDGLYVDIIYQEGIIGLGVWLLLFFVLLVVAAFHRNKFKVYGVLFLLTALVHSITETHFAIWMNVFTIFVLGTISFFVRYGNEWDKETEHWKIKRDDKTYGATKVDTAIST